MILSVALSLGLLLPGLVCGGGMALCMWMMSRGHGTSETKGQASPETDVRPVSGAEVADLRDEITRLRTELADRKPALHADEEHAR